MHTADQIPWSIAVNDQIMHPMTEHILHDKRFDLPDQFLVCRLPKQLIHRILHDTKSGNHNHDGHNDTHDSIHRKIGKC